ncbi:Pilus assembly protein TadC [Halanaeroarchaeum sp. HSR-CO]|uniref:type II secretion system F family protein n=1 Tax=Halanaeroarchaeum sp. HSR-CO TaxID=2866382 RepID=UPI00217E151A|nr:type II secretion system F family protein [Halanaeroarchaeum sp. HSR-CO]UWG46978.1 Pilus assembly protein TadC [Halanaeroarchaeum sp. HSR-CO]
MARSVFDRVPVAALTLDVDSLADIGYPLYRRLFDGRSPPEEFERKLAEARLSTPVEVYLSKSLAVGLLAGVSLWLVGTFLGYLAFVVANVLSGPLIGVSIQNEGLLAFFANVRTPLLVLTTGVVFGTLGFAGGFGALLAYPYSVSYNRRRQINMLLPDAVSYMYALSVGGMNQLEVIQEMAKADDTYGEVSREFRSIVQETEYFDTDYRSAIRKQANSSPSDGLQAFLIDMLSIINSGGDMTEFLEEQKEKHMRTARQEQEDVLETLELFAEMYLTISLFPLLLIIVFVVMVLLGELSTSLLFVAVYGLIPITAVLFLGLVATVTRDEFGTGTISTEGENAWLEAETETGVWNRGLIEAFVGTYRIFGRIAERERIYDVVQVAKRPHHFFRDNPLYTLAVTVPATIALVGGLLATNAVPTTWNGLVRQPIWGTFVYLFAPLYVIALPLAVFHEWNVRSRTAVLETLTDDLRKLASVNDTGMTLLESIGTVGRTSSGKLARELQGMYDNVNYGMSLRESLVEFNNRYRIPRLARTVKLISKSQEASSQITTVLRTAATASENQDDLDRERRSRTRMQVAIIVMTFVAMLGVLVILKTQFIDVMAGLTDGSGRGSLGFGGAVDTGQLSLLFFHAISLQAVLTGISAGYLRNNSLLAGAKYVVALSTVALVVWTVVS